MVWQRARLDEPPCAAVCDVNEVHELLPLRRLRLHELERVAR